MFFVAFGPYAWAILHGETVPSPVSWAIWALVDTLIRFAMKKKGAKLGQINGAVAGAWVITILALFYGQLTMGWVEWGSIALATVGIISWKTTGDAKKAIIWSNVAIFMGSFPEFAIGYRTPEQENPWAWSIWLASCICALCAVRKWDIANALQPLTFTAIEATMVFLVVIRPLL